MCVFSIFLLYLLVVVATRAAVTHDRYLHDNQTKLVVYRRIIVGKTHPFYNLDPCPEWQKPQTIKYANYKSKLSNWRPFLYVVYP